MLFYLLFTGLVLFNAPQTISIGVSTSNDAAFLWGPYRPNVYLGIRARLPTSILMGLMWSTDDETQEFAKSELPSDL